MERQLTLIEPSGRWQIDERTKEIGRRGLARARAELAKHRDPNPRAHRPDAA